MFIDHVAIWTKDLEKIKDFYQKYFNFESNDKYKNEQKKFESYFLSCENGSRVELMKMPGIPENKNDSIKQYIGDQLPLTFLLFSLIICVNNLFFFLPDSFENKILNPLDSNTP